MKKTDLYNPFGSPVYHVAETGSTMQDSRHLAEAGEEDGTVVFADFQSAGRGRVEGRSWDSAPGENLLCTVLLRRPPVPGFTLRVGLAVARTFDVWLPAGHRTLIKWPNDVLVGGKKLAGILCENDGAVLYVGTGLNVGQRRFSPELAHRATSLALALESRAVPTVTEVLTRYLSELHAALLADDWREDIGSRLYRRGERISFLAGDPGRNELLDGYIEGIGPAGELLFRPAGASGAGSGEPVRIFSGEIPYPEN